MFPKLTILQKFILCNVQYWIIICIYIYIQLRNGKIARAVTRYSTAVVLDNPAVVSCRVSCTLALFRHALGFHYIGEMRCRVLHAFLTRSLRAVKDIWDERTPHSNLSGLVRLELKSDDPYDLFNEWYEETRKYSTGLPNALCLATVSK